nr:carbamate kinase [Lachnospiraceae bacterium]
SKKIGRILTEEEAEAEEKKGNRVTEVEGGFRRVVATPKPEDIIELDSIKALLDADNVVIACGGGGIPVLVQDNKLRGASAVIEKDTAAGHMADLLEADMLIMLTGTEKVYLNYGTDEAEALDFISVEDARRYIEEGRFEQGTMAPKIQAAIDYIGDSAVRKVLITKLNPGKPSIAGSTGTMIGK